MVHSRKPSSVAGIQQLCKDEWDRIPPQCCKRLDASYHNCSLQLLLLRAAQPSFQAGPFRFRFFPPNNKHLHLDTAFYVYWCYRCLIYFFVDDLKHLSVTKRRKQERGKHLFHTTVLDRWIKVHLTFKNSIQWPFSSYLLTKT